MDIEERFLGLWGRVSKAKRHVLSKSVELQQVGVGMGITSRCFQNQKNSKEIQFACSSLVSSRVSTLALACYDGDPTLKEGKYLSVLS